VFIETEEIIMYRSNRGNWIFGVVGVIFFVVVCIFILVFGFLGFVIFHPHEVANFLGSVLGEGVKGFNNASK
jgi:hypothetical protein